MQVLFQLSFLAGFAAALSGQGVVPPFQVGQTNPLPGLNPASVPGSVVSHVHMVHLPADPLNVFYCTATVAGLPASYGGAGGLDFVCGSYDVLTDTFTPNSQAAALNTGADERGLMLHHTGLFAVFDRGSGTAGGAWLASRLAVGQPWQIVARITIQCPCYYTPLFHPALADYQGQTHLVYVRSWVQLFPGLNGIVMAPMDLNFANVTGPDTLLVTMPVGLGSPVSPVPVTDPNGELIGVSHSLLDFSPAIRIDRYMSLDLDVSTPAVLMYSNTNPTYAGGFVGGRFFDGQVGGPHISSVDTVWCTGGTGVVGGMMHVRLLSPPTSGAQIYLSAFASSRLFLPFGQPMPPVQGLLGINPAGAWASSLVLHDNLNGEGVISFAIPNSPGLSGVRLPLQSATLELPSGAVYLGNTALLVVQ